MEQEVSLERWDASRPGRRSRSGLLPDPDAAVLQFARLGLEADAPGGRDRERLFQHLAVARTPGGGPGAGRVGLDRDLDGVPAAVAEGLERLVRADRRV